MKRSAPTQNPFIRPWKQRSEEAEKEKKDKSRAEFHLGLHTLPACAPVTLISAGILHLLVTGAPLCAGFARNKAFNFVFFD